LTRTPCFIHNDQRNTPVIELIHLIVRLFSVPISQAFDVTAVRIYRTLINKEIKGDYHRKMFRSILA
jgi:CTP synthase (UTP-ammonia lyase)